MIAPVLQNHRETPPFRVEIRTIIQLEAIGSLPSDNAMPLIMPQLFGYGPHSNLLRGRSGL
jgi:hypothetical protein